ncbi:MAG: penicillin acylase family protein [Proteobacteria bacterium]|nr:penicillin acylase family protein [Pseudomonadota bacterium]
MTLPTLLARLAGGLLLAGSATATPPAQTATVEGLRQPATMIVDHWGIAHLYAASPRDAYFLQGYNAARDRLWQIDLWRKRGLGRLARSLGPAYAAQDRAARLFLYRGDLAQEWAAYAPGAKATATAFVAGINAYVAEVRRGAKPLPVEFQLTGSEPEPWRADDVVRIRSHALVGNVASEVERARVLCLAGPAADRLRGNLEPAHELQVPAGLDPCAIPPDVLADYQLGTQPVRFAPPRATAEAAAEAPRSPEGSNNWVIAPSHSATGRAILANDPHRALTVPSLRYVVHLEAPGLSLIGAGEPALPGVSLGHNGHVGFGLTIFEVDQEDLYVYELNPADPDEYRYRGGWEKMRTVHETVEVRGAAPQAITLKFTRHGPVLRSDPKTGRAFALRTVWSEPGTSPYFESTWLATAQSWRAFLRARDHWGTPPLNLVYADVAGNIGWAPGARVPVRRNWDGLLPVPGDGRYEWQGFLPGPRLPAVQNPAAGWFATANEMNLPAQYPANPPISYEWANRSRIDRIAAVLAAKGALSLEDSMALQNDNHDPMAGRFLALLHGLSSPDPEVAHALALLRGWDLDESPASTAATIYQAWINDHVAPTIVSRLTPESVHAILDGGALESIADYLEHPDARLGPDPVRARDELLLHALEATLADLGRRLGPDPAAWQWGKVHQMAFRPAIAPLADPELGARLAPPAVALGGSGNAPHATAFDPPSFAVVAGASVRIVLDVGDWDRSVMINAPGQSADAGNPHYADLLAAWAEGRYVPLRYTRAAVEEAAESVTRLTPAPRPR